MFPFRLNAMAQKQNAHAEHFHMTGRILCHECEMLLKFILNFFELMANGSWNSVLILINWIDPDDPQNGSMHVKKR